LGYSNPVMVKKVEGISFDVPTNTTIVVKGIDKQLVGQVAANIREIRKPEPYKGKGIRYQAEYVRRKVGKAGAIGRQVKSYLYSKKFINPGVFMRTKLDLRSTKERRKLRTRSRVKNVADRPRLCVFRSNKYIYGQIVDIDTGKSVTGISSKVIEKRMTIREKYHLALKPESFWLRKHWKRI
jgi:hypothetical protein